VINLTDLLDVHKIYNSSLYIENNHIIDMPLATYIGKDAGKEPIWLNPIAPSGFGKTTAILPLLDLAFDWKNPTDKENILNKKYDIYFVDDITSATFGSGSASKSKEGDLGHWLQDRNTLLIISDLSPILTMDSDSKNKLFGKFRTLYDGYIKVDTGAGNKFYQNIHMNMLAFATAEARRHLDLHTSLGTREITYEIPKTKNIYEALLKKDTKEDRENRSNIVKEFIDDLHLDWKFAEEQLERDSHILIDLSEKISYWRAAPVTDENGYLSQHVEPEYPMRVKNQLESLYKAFVVIGVNNPLGRLIEIVNTCGNPVRREILSKMFVVENDSYVSKDRLVNSYYLSHNLGLSPKIILTNLFVLRDMNLVKPVVEEEEKYSKKIDFETVWFPLVRWSGM